jgi:hypothetical protein
MRQVANGHPTGDQASIPSADRRMDDRYGTDSA